MAKKCVILFGCLMVLISSVQSAPGQTEQAEDTASRYEQRIGRLPKPLAFVVE